MKHTPYFKPPSFGTRTTYSICNRCIAAASLIGSSVVCMAGSAEAKPQYPARVEAVLKHLDDHPIKLASIAMMYEPAPGAPVPDVVRGLAPVDVLPHGTSDTTGDTLQTAAHHARVIAALMYLACGALDHAHNLVTPLCWGSPTHYGGRPIAGSKAATEASYVHALIHLLEGDTVGEFGTGYSNANYWHAATGRSHPIHRRLLERARELAGTDPELLRFVENHGGTWQPQRLVALCMRASGQADGPTRAFCEGVVNAEWRLLLDFCYQQLSQ